MTLLCKSLGILVGIGNPVNECGIKITPDINPIYVGLGKSCHRDSKNYYFLMLDFYRMF